MLELLLYLLWAIQQQSTSTTLSITVNPASNHNFFVAATALGTGNSCDNALSYTFFNNPANWGPGATQIGPGSTVHVCGSIPVSNGVTVFTFQASGTSGNVITLKFETGASISAGYLNVGINQNGKSYVLIDGGTNGIIQNTQNGSSLANQQGSGGVSITCGNNIEVEHLNINNIYVHVPSGSDGGSSGGITVNPCGSAQSGLHIHDNTIHDAHSGIFVGYGPGFSNSEINNNTVYNITWGVAVLDNNSGSTATGLNIHDNDIHDFSNWFDTGFAFHFDGIFLAATNSSTSFTASNVYNNKVWGTMNVNGTGYLYLSGSSGGLSGINVFNNLFGPLTQSGTGTGEAGVVIGFSSKHILFVNNTIIGTSGSIPQDCLRIRDTGNLVDKMENNLMSSCGSAVHLYASNTVTTGNYNLYDLPATFFLNRYFVHPDGTFWATLAQWISSTGLDTPNSVSADPMLDMNFVPQAGSPALAAATNLTSLCSTIPALCFDKPLVVGAGASHSSNARPSVGNWDMGAYQ